MLVFKGALRDSPSGLPHKTVEMSPIHGSCCPQNERSERERKRRERGEVGEEKREIYGLV